MIRSFSAVSTVLMCLYTLRVDAGCPAGFDINSFAKMQSQESDKNEKQSLEDKLRLIIPLADADKDNKTSLEELTTFTEKSLKAVFKEEAKARLKALDKNKDDKLSWEEYLKSKENIGASTEEQKRRRFNHADEDKDGQLTEDQVISMFHPEESPHMFDVVVDEYLEMADSNKDGFIALEEYKSMVKKGKGSEKAAKQFFTLLDKDQDEKISRDEIKVWLTSLNTASKAKKQAQQLLDATDDNKDGLIDVEEILNHKGLFLGGDKDEKPKKTSKGDGTQNTEKKSKDEL